MRLIGTTICLAALALALAIPGAAGANLRIGSNLKSTPEATGYNCNSTPCTVTSPKLAKHVRAHGGVRSPVQGTIVRFRVRSGPVENDLIYMRVLRPIGGGKYVGIGTSGGFVPAVNAVSTVTVSMPILIGDLIGADCCHGGNTIMASSGGKSKDVVWGTTVNSPLANGGLGRTPDSSHPGGEVLASAEIIPTNTFTLGTIKARARARTTIVTNLSNPGKVVATGAGLKRTRSTAHHPGKLRVKVKPSAKSRKRLAHGNPVSASVKLRFTPTGGTSTTQTTTVTLLP